MTSSIRLVAIDLDGTMLRADKTLPECNAQAVREAAARGLEICLASGRVVTSIRPFAEQLGIACPIVSCNGAYVVDSSGAEVHHEKVDPSIRDEVIEYVRRNDLHLNVYCKDKVYFSRWDRWAEIYLERVKFFQPIVAEWDELARLEPTKMLFMDSPDGIAHHHRVLSEQLDSSLVSITISEPEYIEFLPAGVSKGVGVESLATYLGLESRHVAAIGDWMNDLEMIQWAGYAGAVANAADPVKEAADVVVASHEDCGVAEFLRSIVYNGAGRL